MLVLTRRPGEVVMVGDAALIVLQVEGVQVKLGFEFPRAQRIVRSEIADEGPNDAARVCLVKYDEERDDRAERRARFFAAMARKRVSGTE